MRSVRTSAMRQPYATPTRGHNGRVGRVADRAHGRRHPLRHAAARGRLAARRSSRPTTTACTSLKFRGAGQGAAGAGRRGGRGRARPRARPARARARARRARPGARRAPSPTPRSSDLLARERRPQPRPGLPARRAGVRARARRRAGPRSSPPTSCGSTRSSRTSTARPRNPNLLLWHGRLWLIDHGAALYVHHARRRPGAQARRPFPAIARARAAARAPARSRTPTRGWRRGARRRRLEAIAGRTVPAAWLDGDPAARRRAHVDYLLRRLAPPRAFVGGGRACPVPRVARSSTRSCASCRAWSAASASTRASCCSAARGASSAARVALDEARLRALAPDVDAAAVGAHLRRWPGSRRAIPARGRSRPWTPSERFHWLVSPSSTIVQPSDVHTGLSDDPATTLDHLFETLVD